MPDNANTLSPDTAPANGTAPAAGEPAFLTRARRILAGDIRPEDYLPVTPQARFWHDRDMTFAQQRTGLEPAPEAVTRQLRQALLAFHHGGQNIACIEDERGVVVVAVGLEEVGQLLNAVPYADRKNLFQTCPDSDY